MSKKSMRIEVSTQEFDALERVGKEENYTSATAYARQLLRQMTDKLLMGEKPIVDAEEDKTYDPRKPKPRYYARYKDIIYPLFRQHGFWSPCIDQDRLDFFYPEYLEEKANKHWQDYTGELTQWEKLWLLSWINNFDKMIPYYEQLYKEADGDIDRSDLEALVHNAKTKK